MWRSVCRGAVVLLVAAGCSSDDGESSQGCDLIRDRERDLTAEIGVRAGEDDMDGAFNAMAGAADVVLDNQMCFTPTQINEAERILDELGR